MQPSLAPPKSACTRSSGNIGVLPRFHIRKKIPMAGRKKSSAGHCSLTRSCLARAYARALPAIIPVCPGAMASRARSGKIRCGSHCAARRMLNIAWIPKLGWDGHFRDLESVAMGPITGQTNMNLPADELIGRLTAIPGYVTAFDRAFGKGGVTRDRLEQALATFQRSIVSTDAPFDRWLSGDENAISATAKRGFALFNGKANCAACHTGWAFTDAGFHDIGVAKDDDVGRGRLFPTSVKLQHAFKTPTLRDVALRAPYMHDGSIASLAEVIDLYDRGGIDGPSRDNDIRPLNLQDGEKADLIAFLNTLNGTRKAYPIPPLPR